MKELDGKKVLLTGGSRGIGPIIAEALAKPGANVILTEFAIQRSGKN